MFHDLRPSLTDGANSQLYSCMLRTVSKSYITCAGSAWLLQTDSYTPGCYALSQSRTSHAPGQPGYCKQTVILLYVTHCLKVVHHVRRVSLATANRQLYSWMLRTVSKSYITCAGSAWLLQTDSYTPVCYALSQSRTSRAPGQPGYCKQTVILLYVTHCLKVVHHVRRVSLATANGQG